METLRYLGFLAVCGLAAIVIIFVGWDEPLRYRFMSPVAIAAEESARHPLPEVAPPTEPPEQASRGSALEQGPWRMDRHGRR